MLHRPREHVLEEESRRAFSAVIPAEWVVRPQIPDYGLDEEVQIFKGGIATQLRFLAQLKSTDSPVLVGDSIKYRFPCRHLLYYANGNTPVMLVVYNAQHKTLFYDWVQNQINNFSTNEISSLHTQESITLHLNKRLLIDQHQQIERELRQLYFQSGNPPPDIGPYKISLTISLSKKGSTTPISFDQTALQSELRGWLSRIIPRQFMILDSEEPDALINIDLDKQTLTFGHFDPPIQLSISDTADEQDGDLLTNTRDFALSCKILIAFLAAAAGLVDHSRRMLAELITQEEQFRSGLLAYLLQPAVARIFAEAEHASDAMDLAEFLQENGHTDAALMLAAAVPMQQKTNLLLRQRYRRLLKATLKFETLPERKSAIHYSLANSLRSSGYHREALAQYIHAAQSNKDYLTRSYWWAEFAGCLLSTGHPRLSLFYYRVAKDMGESGLPVQALIADVLLHLGRFKESLQAFNEHVAAGGQLSAEFLLKQWLAEFFATTFGNVRRHISLALKIAREAYALPHDVQFKRLEDAIRLDPLCDYAWYNYAAFKSIFDPKNEFSYRLAAAILSPWDITAQFNGLAVTQSKNDEGSQVLYAALLAVMYENNPTALERELQAQALQSAQGNAQEASQKVRIIMDLAEKAHLMFSSRESREGFAFRLY